MATFSSSSQHCNWAPHHFITCDAGGNATISGLTEDGLEDSPRSVRASEGNVSLLPPDPLLSFDISTLETGPDDSVMCVLFVRDPEEECFSPDLLETTGQAGSSPYIAWISARISGGSEAKTEGSNSQSAGKFVVDTGADFVIFLTPTEPLAPTTLEFLDKVDFLLSPDVNTDGPG